MGKSEILIQDYIEGGATKNHSDCTIPCASDQARLDDTAVASQAARLCHITDKTWLNTNVKSNHDATVYIIGTATPISDGAHEDVEDLKLTAVADAAQTLAIHKKVFFGKGLERVT